VQGYTHPIYRELLQALAAQAQMTAQDYLNKKVEF
jgi:hypothetical protein